MYPGLVDQKPLHLLKVRLPLQIGLRPLSISRAQPERRLIDLPQPARGDLPLDLLVPGLKPDVFMNDQFNPALLGQGGGLARLLQAFAERLLADHVHPALRRQADQGQV